MTRFILTLFAAICYVCSFASDEISDFGRAREWCDAAMLDKVEGIWEYPEDHTRVLIRKSSIDTGRYDIIAVDSPDTRLHAGDVIGYLQSSPGADKFEMGVYRSKSAKGVFSQLAKCMAQLSDKDDAILVKGRKVKFSLGSTRWLLPSFWRLLRISVKDPLESLPKGLIRVYPPSKKRQPDYL